MGITNLKKLIVNVAIKRHLAHYSGKTLAVDASIWLYRFLYRDDKNSITEGILRQLKQFHKYRITPVYVFDGKSSSEIKLVVEKRQQQRQKVKDTLDTLGVELEETLETLGDPVSAALVMDEIDNAPSGNIRLGMDETKMPFSEMDVPLFVADEDDEEYRTIDDSDESSIITESEDLMMKAVRIQSRIMSLQKQVRRPTKEMVDECKQIFELLGVPYRQSPGESDVTLAEMFINGEVHGIVSEDTDMLPYGCECFITGFMDNNEFVTEYRLTDILNELKITREQFVDLCILCGCDYAEKIYKIAVKTAYTMIKRYGTIERVLEYIGGNKALSERHTYSPDFLEQVGRARNMFLRRCATTTDQAITNSNNTSNPVAIWNFEVVSEQMFCAFLKERSMNSRAYFDLCKPWNANAAAPSKAQKTLFDYYKK